MPLIACNQCRKEFEDDVLCCPHCGAAQIPQFSKAELRILQRQEASGPLGATYLGMAIGLVIGAGYFVFTLIQGTADLSSTVSILLFGMAGSALGFAFHRFYLARKQKRS